MRILVVDDDELLAQTLVTHLTAQYYAVDVATDGEAGWDYAEAATYDLIVLDVNLPKLNGIRLCQKLRQAGYSEPILLLTAKGESSDKVIGLDAGADDYVVKPCTIEELGARIRALLRRQTASPNPVLTWGELRLNPSTCEVTYQESPLSLSPKEYGLLELFLRSPQRVFNSSLILEHLWGFEDSPGEETVRTHIKRLRRRLKSVGAEDVIETIYGMGYRLKPPIEPPIEPPVSLPDQARNAAMEAWEYLKGTVLERLVILDRAVEAFQAGNLPESIRSDAEQAAHKLAGSLGMFGFPEGSRLGREIERWFQNPNWLESPLHLQTIVTKLHQELQRPPSPVSDGLFSDPEVEEVPSPQGKTPVLLMIDDDVILLQQFQQSATLAGIQVETALSVTEARMRIAQRVPDIVLLDLGFPDAPPQEGLVLLEELGDRFPRLPILIFSVSDQFHDRLEAARRSKHRFISKSTPPDQVLDFVREVLKNSQPDEITVLAVDDDPLILETLRQFLPRWGINLVTLSDSQQLWETLTTTMPDLLILDVEMPNVNGIELCQVIRNDGNWNQLPILFLSALRDSETVHHIYSAGADDYISKPFVEPELVTRIFNRLERNRLLRNLAETDQLTGIANRRQSMKEFNRYLTLSQRYVQPLCLAVLDLDHFKQVNDQYGHDSGDRVLKRFAQILRNVFCNEEIVGRWGGEEFLVGLYGFTKQQAKLRFDQIFQLMRQESFISSENAVFKVTFSAGLAQAPIDGADFHHLYRVADAALYQAKTSGRDRLICA
ncbi:MAG: response regulator [Scytolyngbya sp. HA4215-MV1]|jgi:diguanylate cyclase (GGDEF)-like protein|nr:response regulator [Scytolyngbya sp. HA4215-MV1]